MDLDAFWKIIDDSRAGAFDDSAFLSRVNARLRMLTPEELLAFEDCRSELDVESYSWELWGAAYLINGGCSDDGFDYFRAWLMSQGRAAFENALKNPDTLADLHGGEDGDREFEDFLYVAQEAYEEKTGGEMPDSIFLLDAPRPDPSECWDFDDKMEMKKRYPKLFARHGW